MPSALTVPAPIETPRKANDWRALIWAFLFFWYFSGITHLLIQLDDGASFVGFRRAMLASLLWLIPIVLWPRHTRRIGAILGVPLWCLSLFSLGYYSIYGQEFSQSVLFIAFESNTREAGEYFAQYFAWWMLPALLAYAGGAFLLWRRLRPASLTPRAATGTILTILLLVFVAPQYKDAARGVLSWHGARSTILKHLEPAVPWQMAIGYTEYQQQLGHMQELLEQNRQLPPLANLVDTNAGRPTTLVLVIGESTNRQHMSLYGYHRQTTPRLDGMRDQLRVFRNVVSPRPYTIEALQQILTFADQEHPDLHLDTPSLLNMMKQAGYKTFWITNQQTLTKRNTMLTSFSQQTDEQYYLNNNRDQNARSYDDQVLDPLRRVLDDPALKKLIVVHLLGTHMRYEFRYPEEATVFRDKQGLPDWADARQTDFINQYDNAVRFQDKVLAELIDTLAAKDGATMMTYLSDHGEDVFDSAGHDVIGRNEGRPTLPMYAVPFLVWESPEWRRRHPRDYRGDLDRAWQTSHFIHTWADLVGITFDGHDPSKSLVNPAFRERPLWAGNPGAPKQLVDLRTLPASARRH